MPQFNPDSGLSAGDISDIIASLPEFMMFEPFICESQASSVYRYLDTYGFNRIEGARHHAFGFLDIRQQRVATHFWLRSTDAACVFIAHGLFDHVGLYLDLVEALLAGGFNVLAIDFPGHGLSDGEPAVISDFYDYTQVLDGLIARVEKEISGPMYAVGQSTGGAVLLSYVLVRRGEAFEKIALLAPLIRPRAWRFINIAHGLLSPVLRFVKRNFTVNSHRDDFVEYLAHGDPLQSRSVSVQWIGAMKRWIKAFDQLEISAVPALIVQGDGDTTVDWQKNLPSIKSKFRQCQVVMVEGAKHHLVKEGDTWRNPVFSQVLHFFKQGT